MTAFTFFTQEFDPDNPELADALCTLGFVDLFGIQNGVHFIDIEISDPTRNNILDCVRTLQRIGIVPIRIDLDLVTISGIADRLTVTKQAIKSWTQTPTQGGISFPTHVSTAGISPVWAWNDVYEYLYKTQRSNLLEDVYSDVPLSLNIAETINGLLATERSSNLSLSTCEEESFIDQVYPLQVHPTSRKVLPVMQRA